MSRLTCILAVVWLFQCQSAMGQLRWSIEEDGTVYVESTALTAVLGLDFQSNGSHLRVGKNASPFTFFMAATSDRVIFSKLSSEVWIDGSLSLDLKVDRAFISDVSAAWTSLSAPPTPMPLVPDAPASTPRLRASFPSVGGPITIEPIDAQLELTQIMLFVDHGISRFSIGDDPYPFTRFSPNTASRENRDYVELTAQEIVSLDGPVTLDILVAPDTKPSDLRANWRRNHFEIGTVEFVPEPQANSPGVWLVLAVAMLRSRRSRFVTSRAGKAEV